MADQSTGDPQLHAALKALSMSPYPAAAVGAVLSMAFGERLTVRGRALSVAIGFASAVFIAPALIALGGLVWPGGGPLPKEMQSCITFTCGLFGMIALGGLAPAVARYAKNPMGLVRVQVGGVTIGGELAATPPAENTPGGAA